jgi:hypothetical protein
LIGELFVGITPLWISSLTNFGTEIFLLGLSSESAAENVRNGEVSTGGSGGLMTIAGVNGCIY